MTTTIRLAGSGAFLATRARGAWFREQAEALPPGEDVVLDWSGVEAITASFGDELAGKLAAAGTREVRSTGMCPEVRETLDLVRRRRGMPCPDCLGTGEVQAAGHTCGTGPEGYCGLHEPGCGAVPCPRGCPYVPHPLDT